MKIRPEEIKKKQEKKRDWKNGRKGQAIQTKKT